MEGNILPKHWQIKRLGEVCDKISLNGIKIKQKDYLTKGKYPVVDQGQESIGGYYNDESLVVPTEPPYIIFGDHTRVKKFITFKFIAGADGVKVLKPHTIFNPKFFFYLIHVIKIPNKGYARHFQFLEKEDIPIPPLFEQQAIVSKIEELLSDLENGKQQLQLAQQQLKIYRQSLLKWAFEGRFGYAQRPSNAVKDGELPIGWKLVELREVADKISDGPFGSNLKSVDYISQGVRVIRLENIGQMKFRNEYQTFVSNEKYESIKKHTVGKGDIIFSSFISESIRSVILPEYIDRAINKADCFLVRVSQTKINRKYLAYYFSTKAMQNQLVNQIHGATRPRINTNQLKSSLIPVAPLDEQNQIVDELESKLTVCDKIEETISHSLLQAETLRQSILKKAFEGKLITYR